MANITEWFIVVSFYLRRIKEDTVSEQRSAILVELGYKSVVRTIDYLDNLMAKGDLARC